MTPELTTPNSNITETFPDRIRLDRMYDVERLQREVYLIVSTLTQQFYFYYLPVLLVQDVETPSSYDWASEPMLGGCSYLHEVFAEFETEITNIRLMRLGAGEVVKEHKDPTLDAVFREIIRLTLPVFSDENVKFLLNGTEVPMKPGELWYMKLSERHSVHNNMQNERINMSIDVKWNGWVEDWLASNAS